MYLRLNTPPLRKSKTLFTLLLLCSSAITCSAQTVKPEDYGRYHPLTPKIDRMYNLDPASVNTDKGENFWDRGMHPFQQYLFIYKNRKFSKVEATTMLKNTTLLVVIDSGQTEIKNALNKAFSTYWKFNKYMFINRNDVKHYAGRKEYSFFMFTRDEHYIPSALDRKGINSWNPPHLFYRFDSMQHAPSTAFFHQAGDFVATYMFLLCINNGNIVETNDEDQMEHMSIADYILTGDPSVNGLIGRNYSYDDAGTLMQREHDVIPQINTVVANFEDDLEFMYKTRFEYISKKTCESQVSKCHLLYKDSKVELKLNLFVYNTTFKKALKGKTLYINRNLTDELGRSIIAFVTGLDKSDIKMVPRSEIDSLIIKGTDNDNVLVLEDLSLDCYGYYQISTTLGEELMGLEPKRTIDALGSFDVLGTDAWSERKNVSLIDK
ncbi:MAG TPA: hypothetical protein VNZ45_13945 [Bacteroidia bacterium]|jgi:hypothetical protein|nr:hypothetical protein [Bacteroidia bacterium]